MNASKKLIDVNNYFSSADGDRLESDNPMALRIGIVVTMIGAGSVIYLIVNRNEISILQKWKMPPHVKENILLAVASLITASGITMVSKFRPTQKFA